ncbi:winged helix-turn-helix transcriptional regulator, partial [bacterium]|nr:winged helix-turn-helix transcriptional regulator [bacterium]
PPAPLVVVGGLTSAAVLLGYSTDKGRYGLWMFFIPLYSRIRKEKTLDDFNRGQIYRTITEHPGIRYSEIGAKVGIGNGVLTHHLKVLQSMEHAQYSVVS